jgi:hypothetical protein
MQVRLRLLSLQNGAETGILQEGPNPPYIQPSQIHIEAGSQYGYSQEFGQLMITTISAIFCQIHYGFFA